MVFEGFLMFLSFSLIIRIVFANITPLLIIQIVQRTKSVSVLPHAKILLFLHTKYGNNSQFRLCKIRSTTAIRRSLRHCFFFKRGVSMLLHVHEYLITLTLWEQFLYRSLFHCACILIINTRSLLETILVLRVLNKKVVLTLQITFSFPPFIGLLLSFPLLLPTLISFSLSFFFSF